MPIELQPLLSQQREIYDLPKGADRFRHYLDVMLAGTRDMQLPLALMNPMGKPHVAERLDAWIELGAEEVAQTALAEAVERLGESGTNVNLRLALVVVDDAKGGWTNRYTTEMSHRFGRSGELNRGWVVALLWTGEAPTASGVRSEVLSSVYRALHRGRLSPPETLADMMLQEGRSAAFAGQGPALPESEVAEARELLGKYLEASDFPTQFTCLYGDEIGESLGYRPLGLPRRAGYEVGLADATSPESAFGDTGR